MNHNYEIFGSREWLEGIKSYDIIQFEKALKFIEQETQNGSKTGKALVQNRIYEILNGEYEMRLLNEQRKSQKELDSKYGTVYIHPFRRMEFIEMARSCNIATLKVILDLVTFESSISKGEVARELSRTWEILYGEYCKKHLEEKIEQWRNWDEKKVKRGTQ